VRKRASTKITAPFAIIAWDATHDHQQANILCSADPDDISAQINLIGVLGPMIGGKPSAAPNGG
jgi:hypothetical protein